MHVAFLVYDSRSGSTLLSRLIVERLQRVAVTQEIGFEHLLRAAARRQPLTAARAMRCLRRDYLRNLGLSMQQLQELVRARQEPIQPAELIRAILAAHVQRTSRISEPSCVVVKYGRHVLQWAEIARVFGAGAKLLHLVRDPRAVINSKLKTQRPYFPFESFAWGGSLLAAVRWRGYCRSFRAASRGSLATKEIRFEDLVASPEPTLEQVGLWLGADAVPQRESYVIPEAERGIHAHVADGRVHDHRAQAFLDELPRIDQRRVEAVLAAEMLRRGYALNFPSNSLRRAAVLAGALPPTAFHVARHFWRHAAWRLGSSRRVSAHST